MIKGWWYSSGSSARRSAELSTHGDRFIVTADIGDSVSGNIDELEISSRVGNIPRRIVLPDQSLFETENNEGVDQLLREFGCGTGFSGALHHLETHWRWIGVALMATLIIGFATVYWGMPWASRKIAFSLPLPVLEVVSEQALEIMDQGILSASELPLERQQRIREHFRKRILSATDGEYSFQLHFRNMQGVANAFALPSGAIVVTDGLVELADDQNQIDAVLFHEMGHVVHRHGMQQILHSSFMTMAVILVSGDVTAIDNTAVALPVFLLESHYSREDETEADTYAFEAMIQAGVDPGHFGRIMEKLSESPEPESDPAVPPEETTPREKVQKEQKSVLEYLSTHPPTPERIRQANYYSELFKRRRLEKAESASVPESAAH